MREGFGLGGWLCRRISANEVGAALQRLCGEELSSGVRISGAGEADGNQWPELMAGQHMIGICIKYEQSTRKTP